jgi:hypothetical protein
MNFKVISLLLTRISVVGSKLNGIKICKFWYLPSNIKIELKLYTVWAWSISTDVLTTWINGISLGCNFLDSRFFGGNNYFSFPLPIPDNLKPPSGFQFLQHYHQLVWSLVLDLKQRLYSLISCLLSLSLSICYYSGWMQKYITGGHLGLISWIS